MEGTLFVVRSASLMAGNVCDGVGDAVDGGEHDVLGLIGDADKDDDAGIGPGAGLIDEVDPLRWEGPMAVVLLIVIDGETSVSLEELGCKREAFVSSELPASVGSGRVLGDTTIFELSAIFGYPEETKCRVGENDVKDGEAWEEEEGEGQGM